MKPFKMNSRKMGSTLFLENIKKRRMLVTKIFEYILAMMEDDVPQIRHYHL